MKRIFPFAAGACLILALAGCHSKVETPAPITAENPAAIQDPAGPITTSVIAAARNSLKAGNVDEAAATLAQLRLQGASFNAQQAADYRQAISEAYDRAVEGAQRGDPKALAAMQLLRAASPR